jgi:hypothetical protein
MKRFDLLRSPLLLLLVGVLLLNDFVLKAAFHDWITGKLSDVAGLAALTIFCCALWPRHVWWVGCAMAGVFIWWKSPLSQPALDMVNDFAPWPVRRTVDYSDLLALPAVWWVCRRANRLRVLPAGRVWVWPVAGLCLFAFGASMLFPTGYGSWHKAYLRADGATDADRTIGVSRLEHEIDDVATKHGWTGACRQPPCPGLLAGRTYTAPMQSVAVLYEAERKGLRFTLSAADTKDVERIKEEIGRAVKERLPSWTVGEWIDPPRTDRSLRLHIASRSAEVDRAVAVVTRVFRTEGLSEPVQPAMEAGQKAIWGHKTYSAGPPVDGPSRALAIVADWKVQDDRQQWRVVVNVTAGAPEHVERQARIVEALRQALAREFGTDAVY